MTTSNLFAALIVLTAITSAAFAQPPRGQGRDHDGPPRSHPVLEVIDQNQDHEISAEEIENASKNLLSLDKNNDGVLNADDLGDTGKGRGGRQGGQRGQRPPGGGEGVEYEDGGRRGDDGQRGGGRQRRGGEAGGQGGSRAERFIERAMSFDANEDGMLSQEELTTMAEEMSQRGGRGGEGGPRGGGRQGGGGRPGGGGDRAGGRPE